METIVMNLHGAKTFVGLFFLVQFNFSSFSDALTPHTAIGLIAVHVHTSTQLQSADTDLHHMYYLATLERF